MLSTSHAICSRSSLFLFAVIVLELRVTRSCGLSVSLSIISGGSKRSDHFTDKSKPSASLLLLFHNKNLRGHLSLPLSLSLQVPVKSAACVLPFAPRHFPLRKDGARDSDRAKLLPGEIPGRLEQVAQEVPDRSSLAQGLGLRLGADRALGDAHQRRVHRLVRHQVPSLLQLLFRFQVLAGCGCSSVWLLIAVADSASPRQSLRIESQELLLPVLARFGNDGADDICMCGRDGYWIRGSLRGGENGLGCPLQQSDQVLQPSVGLGCFLVFGLLLLSGSYHHIPQQALVSSP